MVNRYESEEDFYGTPADWMEVETALPCEDDCPPTDEDFEDLGCYGDEFPYAHLDEWGDQCDPWDGF